MVGQSVDRSARRRPQVFRDGFPRRDEKLGKDRTSCRGGGARAGRGGVPAGGGIGCSSDCSELFGYALSGSSRDPSTDAQDVELRRKRCCVWGEWERQGLR